MKELELKVKGEYSEAGMKPWENLLITIKNDISFASHFNARTLDEAVHLLRAYEDNRARLIGGGTDVLRMVKSKYVPELPGVLVNIKTVSGLSFIKEENGVLKIGALTTLSEIGNSEVVKTRCGVLAETAGVVGSPQVRNMATIAGSLCQDVCCWYYRAENNYFHCLRKGGTFCPAIAGDNRWMFSIFGATAGCYATCQSDMVVTLTALGALLKTTHRVIPIEQFYIPTSPWNILEPDEIITEVQVPAGVIGRYLKFSIRKSIDHPLVSVACVAQGKEISLVVGGVSLMPYIVNCVTDLLHGKLITRALAEQAGDIAIEAATPMSINSWKIEVMRTLVKRALLAIHTSEGIDN